MGGCHLHKKKLASGVLGFDWRAGSDSFFVPSLAFGAQTVPASHFLNAIFSKARLTERGRIVCDEDSFKFHLKMVLEAVILYLLQSLIEEITPAVLVRLRMLG